MKKGTVSFLSILCTLGVLAGVGAGLYYGSKKVRDAADGLIDSIKGSTLNPGTSESISGSTGLNVLLPQGRLFANADVGAIKSVTATLSPANVTNKKIVWLSSDETKVSVVSKYTQSGAANTLKLVAYFTGNVTITASSAAFTSVKTTFTVSFENFIKTAALKGFYADGDGAIISNGSEFSDCCNGYGAVASDGSVGYHVGNAVDCYAGWVVELNGAVQSSFSVPTSVGGFEVSSVFGDETGVYGTYLSSVIVLVDLTAKIGEDTASDAQTYSLAFGRAPALTVKTFLYVAPTSMSGGAAVVF